MWGKQAPPPPLAPPPGMPTSFIVCTVMWFIHGFVLDVVVIGVLPFLSASASDAQRADKFPWALGGYSGFAKVPNLAPTHRRFIAENAAYALLRIAPAFFIQNVEVLLLAVISYFIEGVTIAWEISCYKAPAGSMVPQTLMAVFASIVTYTVTNNAGGYIPNVDASLLTAMQGFCAATWGCWLVGALSTATAKEDGHRV
mmetsp:Transcript_5128/g.14989  ORF Transcript_5128/g.14989 Transcript_5128/m.14989 type:complete len:199 (+) Transcript_5128:29-625(+)